MILLFDASNKTKSSSFDGGAITVQINSKPSPEQENSCIDSLAFPLPFANS